MLIDRFTTLSFLLLLVVGMVLPSDGNHGLLSPKSLAFLMAAFSFTLTFLLSRKFTTRQSWGGMLIGYSALFLGIWTLVGIDQSPFIPSGQLDQLKVFLTTLFVPFAGWYLVQKGMITSRQIFRTVIFGNLGYSFVKVSLMALHVFGAINLFSLMYKTGLRFMSMPIVGDVARLQTSVDILTPFLVYFVLQSDRLCLNFSKKFKVSYCVISALAVFLSFSRLLAFAYVMSLLLYTLTLRLSSQLKMWTCSLFLCLAGVAAAGPEKVGQVIEKRFFSTDNERSDATRVLQINALMNGCDENPFFGKGLGGYTTECIRDKTLPHSYEVQWMAFLLQFGIIGLLLLLVPIALIAKNFIKPPLSAYRLGFFFLFGVWLLSGFTNPFMISLGSGIIYLLFLLAGTKPALSK